MPHCLVTAHSIKSSIWGVYASSQHLFDGWPTDKAKHYSRVVLLISFVHRVLLNVGLVGKHLATKVRSSHQWTTPLHTRETALPVQMMSSSDINWREKGDISAWLLSLSFSVTYVMRALYGSHNWSHMSVFSLQQEAQSRAQACHGPARPPTASHTAPEVHRVCWQGDLTPARHTCISPLHQKLTVCILCCNENGSSWLKTSTSERHCYELSSQHCSCTHQLLHPFLVTSHRHYVTFLNETKLSCIQLWLYSERCAIC